MVRFDFKKTYCKGCEKACSHTRNCYKSILIILYKDALSKIDLRKELKSKSPEQVSKLLQNLGFENFRNKDVYRMMEIEGIPIRSVKEAANSKQCRDAYKKTCLEKYGAENALSKDSPIFEKRNQTIKEKYGVNNVFQLDTVKEKIKESLFEKFGDYQGFYEYCSKKFKEKYGVDNPLLLQDVQEKGRITKLEKYGTISNSINTRTSSIHLVVSEFLNSINIEHENENTKLLRYKDNMGKLHWPIPDIHLLGRYSNIIIEINGDYFHANPNIYKENDLIKRFGEYKKVKDIWDKDKDRNSNIEKLGYKVLVVWESEIEDGSFCQKIIDFLKIGG